MDFIYKAVFCEKAKEYRKLLSLDEKDNVRRTLFDDGNKRMSLTLGVYFLHKNGRYWAAKAFKAYREGRWNIHDLLEFHVEKIRQNNYCWYCGKEMEPSKLTKDHVFPRSKGGDNDMDNIIMVCKTCNSSKGDMDLFEWYAEVRKEWPPINVFVHYLKNIYLYSIENGLMDKHSEELDTMDLPFNWRYIPVDFPQPEVYL